MATGSRRWRRGYPGYGSYLLLLPEHGVGLFALSNRAGLLTRSAPPVSDALALTYHYAGDIWQRGNLDGARDRLAMNFLMDRSAENWARELARLKAETGGCETASPITPTGMLSGTFTWTCARGTLRGQLLLAPTSPPTIQALRFNVVQP